MAHDALSRIVEGWVALKGVGADDPTHRSNPLFMEASDAIFHHWARVRADHVLDMARAIIRPYRTAQITPTLRQVYYRFVALGVAPNSGKTYSKIGRVLAEARACRDMDLDWIEDRTRSPGLTLAGVQLDVDAAVDDIVDAFADAHIEYLWANRWAHQDTLVSVWVEKEALASVFERVCAPLGVGLFVCRGYPSVSSIGEWLIGMDKQIQRLQRYGNAPTSVHVLYFGDHDPDGLQIPDSAMARVRQIARAYNTDLGVSHRVSLTREAITPEQARRLNAPPMEAKTTSARYNAFFEKTGSDQAWELDAVPPDALQGMIRDAVAPYFNDDIYDEVREEVQEAREALVRRILSGDVTGRILERMREDMGD